MRVLRCIQGSAVAMAASLLALGLPGPALATVDEQGAFTTRVGIEVPAFHGIQPAVALNYASTSGDGLLGAGWSLQAASYISRSSPDGGAPRFDAADVYRLDGEELVGCAPNCRSGG